MKAGRDSMYVLPIVIRYIRLEKSVAIPDNFDSKRLDARRF